jgi:hypothetical protein
MKQLWVVLTCLFAVLWRRLRVGKRHPAWTLFYEVGVEVCGRQVAPRHVFPGKVRALPPATPIPLGLLGRVDLERVVVGGRASEQHTPKGW